MNDHDIFVVEFITKGENNPAPDNEGDQPYTVHFSDVIGKCDPDDKLSGVGNVISFLRSSLGFFLCIVLPLILFFLYELYNFISILITERQKKAAAGVAVDEEEIKKRAVEEYLAKQANEEESLFCTLPLCEPYATELRQDFRKWLDERNIEYDAENCTLFGVDKDAPLVRYKVEKEKAYFDEMYNHLKAIGVKIPICGTNYIMHAGLYESNSYQDFRDSHAYFHRIWENSMWGEFPEQKKLESFSTCWRGDSGFSKLFHMRSLDQPFFVSEWNMTWPNFYRAEGPIQHAALGCLQGFAGFAIHTYSYQSRQTDDMLLGKETHADAIAGVAYREGIFSCWNDPACYGLFYHAALMTRRADVAEANRTIGIKVNAERSRERAEFLNKDLPYSQDWYLEKRFDRMAPCYYGLTEVSKVGNYIDEVPEGVDEVYEEPQWTIDTSKLEVLSDNGQMYRSWGKEYGWVDSDRTKCAYGFLQKTAPWSSVA